MKDKSEAALKDRSNDHANRQRAIAQNRCYRGHTKRAYSDESYMPAHIPAALSPSILTPAPDHRNTHGQHPPPEKRTGREVARPSLVESAI